MAKKAITITLVCVVAGYFVGLMILSRDVPWELAPVVGLLSALIAAVITMGGFIIHAIEKNTAAKSGSPQDSADSTK